MLKIGRRRFCFLLLLFATVGLVQLQRDDSVSISGLASPLEPEPTRRRLNEDANCVIPDTMVKEPFNITDLENYCPDRPDQLECAPIAHWAWKEYRKIVRPERLPALEEAIQGWKPPDNTIMLVTINLGYAALFMNWMCSVRHQGIDPADFTLLVVMEDESAKLAEELGLRHINVGDWLDKKIHANAMETFGLGDYKYIAGAMNVYMTDLVERGFNVLMQDSDITWNRNVLPYLKKHGEDFDILLVRDTIKRKDGKRSRIDKQRNGGFLFYRSNCRTLVYIRSLRNSIAHIFWRRSDQVIMNRMLENYRFKGLKVGYLPDDLFVNGNKWQPWTSWPRGRREDPKLGWMKPEPGNLPINPYIFHASWALDMGEKISKFLNVGQWHLATCELYNMQLIPDVNITSKFLSYHRNFKQHKDWHETAEYFIQSVFRPFWNMTVPDVEPAPDPDPYVGSWTPQAARARLEDPDLRPLDRR